MKNICIFCGSNNKAAENYRKETEILCNNLVKNNLSVVYGGGSIGLMGVLADKMLDLGGNIVGVTTEDLIQDEVCHTKIQCYITKTMHQRKQKIYELADAFIMLPGGLGTLEEFFEILTWRQLGLHSKPCAILNIKKYFDSFLQFIDNATICNFIHEKHKEMIIVEEDSSKLLEFIMQDSGRKVVWNKSILDYE